MIIMKILMLVNWKIKYAEKKPEGLQPPDYYVKEEPYWFFRYIPGNIAVDVVDISSFKCLEKFEHEKIRFYIWQTIKVLSRLNKYDLVISHGMQSAIVLCLLRRIFGKGSYKHIVFDIGAFNSARETGKALRLMQFASKSIDAVIYHTVTQIGYYEKCHPWLIGKSFFVRYGVDTKFFIDAETNKDSIESDYMLCVGYNKRDWETVVDAYSHVNTSIKLRLIGHVDSKLQHPGIEMIDRISITDLKEQIRNAKFCILPLEFLNYSFGQMTLLQQMALQKAVIVADVPSIETYKVPKEKPENIMTYKAGDSIDLSKKIMILLSDSSLIQTISIKAKETVSEQFTEEKMAQEIYKVIEKVMRD